MPRRGAVAVAAVVPVFAGQAQQIVDGLAGDDFLDLPAGRLHEAYFAVGATGALDAEKPVLRRAEFDHAVGHCTVTVVPFRALRGKDDRVVGRLGSLRNHAGWVAHDVAFFKTSIEPVPTKNS